MNCLRLVSLMIFLVCPSMTVWALPGVVAIESDIAQLKEDLRSGRVQIGKTRLKEIRQLYGDAPSIVNSERTLIYDYSGLKIEFEKKKYLEEWKYDSFKSPVYNKDADDLREDLESGEIVGKFVTVEQILKDYGDPTESQVTYEDGEESVYYYGNIKLVFENYILLKKWQMKNFSTEEDTKKSSADKKSTP